MNEGVLKIIRSPCAKCKKEITLVMVNASLAYEILMYLNSFYFGMFASCEIGTGILKVINAEHKPIMELYIIFGWCFLETFRIVLGRRGSLSDKGWQVITSVFLTFPCAGGVVYIIMGESTIKFEYILCALMLFLHVTEIAFSILFIFSLCRPVTYT